MMPTNLFYNGQLPMQCTADLAQGDSRMRRPLDVHIWREAPIALDEWLAEVSDAREWDRHTIRRGRTPSGMELLIGGTPGYVWWMGHSSRDPVAFEFLDGDIRTTDPDEETLKKIREIAGRLRAHVGNRKGEPI